MSNTSKYCVVALVICLSLLQTTFLRAELIILDSKLSAVSFAQDGSIFASHELPLQITISQDGWKIKQFLGNGIREIGCDKQNVFSLITENASNVSFGSVIPGVNPLGGYMEQLPWLAYCSATVRKEEQTFFPPWLFPGSDPEAHSFNVQAEFSTKSPFLPKSIQWVADKEKSISATKSPYIWKNYIGKDRLRELKQWELRLPDGFVSGVYTVSQFIDVGQWEIPEAVNLEVRAYTGEQNGKHTWKVAGSYKLELSHAKIVDDELDSFLPKISSLTHVSDARINPQDSWPVKYTTEDSWILDTSDPRYLELFQKAQSELNHKNFIDRLNQVMQSAMVYTVTFPSINSIIKPMFLK